MSNCKRNAAVGLLVASTCLSGLFGYQGNELSKVNKELKQNVIEQEEAINKLVEDTSSSRVVVVVVSNISKVVVVEIYSR